MGAICVRESQTVRVLRTRWHLMLLEGIGMFSSRVYWGIPPRQFPVRVTDNCSAGGSGYSFIPRMS